MTYGADDLGSPITHFGDSVSILKINNGVAERIYVVDPDAMNQYRREYNLESYCKDFRSGNNESGANIQEIKAGILAGSIKTYYLVHGEFDGKDFSFPLSVRHGYLLINGGKGIKEVVFNPRARKPSTKYKLVAAYNNKRHKARV